MSQEQVPTDDDLRPTETEGFKVAENKTVAELAALDQEDESLQRWKASLGLGTPAAGGTKKVILQSLFLESPTRKDRIILDLTAPPAKIAELKKSPITIKEGIEYSVGVTFIVENEIASGLKFIQVVKRAHLTVDRTEAMLGSYVARPEPYTKLFASEESPSGLLARSGTNVVRSRVIDDDQNVWLDFEWSFKIAKEW